MNLSTMNGMLTADSDDLLFEDLSEAACPCSWLVLGVPI